MENSLWTGREYFLQLISTFFAAQVLALLFQIRLQIKMVHNSVKQKYIIAKHIRRKEDKIQKKYLGAQTLQKKKTERRVSFTDKRY